MAETHPQTPDEAPPDLPKRKPDLDAIPSPEPSKKPKPDEDPTSPAAPPNGSPAAAKKPVDKGKGILEEVEESSGSGSDDDDNDDEVEAEEDDDFVDDPLAEVDLSNILPSRTRRRVVMPGEFVVHDMDDDDDEEEEEDEEDLGVDGDNADDEDSD